MVRVVVVDDHPLVRQSVSDLLEAAGGITVVGHCADGSEIPAVLAHARPDVLLLDLHMPQVSGLAAAAGLRRSHPEMRIVVLTAALSSASVRGARAIGAVGYLLKDDDPAALVDHLRAVARGGTAWHPHAVALLPAASEAPTRRTWTRPRHLGVCSDTRGG